jgi:hypothetical protein
VPHNIAHIVGDEQSTLSVECYPDGSAERIAFLTEKAGEHVRGVLVHSGVSGTMVDYSWSAE